MTCSKAAAKGHLECLKYAHEQRFPFELVDFLLCCLRRSARVFDIRARKRMSLARKDLFLCCEFGHLECLKYAHENGCPWNEETCLCCRKWSPWVFEIRARERCPWDERTCSKAAKYGFNECLEYAREHGCPSDEESDLDWASEWSYDSR